LNDIQNPKMEVDRICGSLGLSSCIYYFSNDANKLESIVNIMVKSFLDNSKEKLVWVYFKSICLESLTQIAENQQLDSSTLNSILEAVLVGMEDFTVSPKGDIGVRVRKAAIKCLEKLLQLSQNDVSNDYTIVIKKLIECCFDKIDAVRQLAFETLKKNFKLV